MVIIKDIFLSLYVETAALLHEDITTRTQEPKTKDVKIRVMRYVCNQYETATPIVEHIERLYLHYIILFTVRGQK